MIYGDLHFFDILVFAGIAAFLIYRLRNVLGKRGGFEKQNNKTKKESGPSLLNKKEIPQLKENETKLSIAYDHLESFDHKLFLEGAKYAFETIINAFNKGDKKTLKNLLTEEVFISFENAIKDNSNNPNYQFYSLVIDGVEDVFLEKELISIKLKITSEQFKDNDESTVSKKQDIWTFQKRLKDKSPIWLLSAT